MRVTRTNREISSCPECGGVAELDRGNRWRCTSWDTINGVRQSVCDARGAVLGGELITVSGSNGIWCKLLEEMVL